MQDLLPDKYEVFVLEDEYGNMDDMGMGMEMMEEDTSDRPCFLLVPKKFAVPEETSKFQYVVTPVLALIGALSCLQVGVGAQMAMVPNEILDAFAQSGTAENQDYLQSLITSWDPLPLLEAAWPIGAFIFGTELAHDFGHRIVAVFKGVKLGPSFFIPNGQIGLFGSITQYKSLCKNRSDMFDIAYGGLAASGAFASALFLSGLILSMDQVSTKKNSLLLIFFLR